MAKGKLIRLVLVPIIFGLIATLIVRQLLNPSDKPDAAASAEMVQVVTVASQTPIAPRTRLSEANLVLKPVPKALLNGAEFTKVADVAGKISVIQLEPGEVILGSRVVAEGQGALPYRIPQGKRAVTLRMDELNGVAGYPEPGDMVDLIFVLPAKTPERLEATARLLFEGVQVLAKGPTSGAAAGGAKGGSGATGMAATTDAASRPAISSLTVALTPEQAVEVSLAEQLGVIKFTLRPALNQPNVGTIKKGESIYR